MSEKLTHRCPACAGTSNGKTDKWGKRKACKVCEPYGPFGLVPEVVAIEQTLRDNVSNTEKVFRRDNSTQNKVVDWLLNDRPMTCTTCGGSGKWVNPNNRRDTRPCFKCDGKGVKR